MNLWLHKKEQLKFSNISAYLVETQLLLSGGHSTLTDPIVLC